MPAEGPLGTGVVATRHVRPPSVEWNTRDVAPPPVANQASRSVATRHVPLAAKANSPSRAGGMPAVGRTPQAPPPSEVDSTRNFPATGPDMTRPWRGATEGI